MKKILTFSFLILGFTISANEVQAINNYGYYNGGYQNTYTQPSQNTYAPTVSLYQNNMPTQMNYGGYGGGWYGGGYYTQPYRQQLGWNSFSYPYSSYGYNNPPQYSYYGGYVVNPVTPYQTAQYYPQYYSGLSWGY